MLQAALQQFYAERIAPPEVHLPVGVQRGRHRDDRGLAVRGRPSRRVRICVPRRGEKRGLLDLAARNAAVAYQARFNENVAANYDALETLRAVLGLPSLPRRIECFDISTIQGSETVASMVVCEDGRMKRGEYRKFRIRGWGQGLGTGAPASRLARTPRAPSLQPQRPSAESRSLDFWTTSPRCTKSCCGATASCSSTAGRFPDLILIDGGKGQLACGLPGARGARAGEPRGGRHREEGRAAVHARPRRRHRAAEGQPGAAADPADPRRGAPVRGDLPPPVAHEARPAVGARRDRRRRPAAAQGAADARSAASPASAAPRAKSSSASSARSAPTPSSPFRRLGAGP